MSLQCKDHTHNDAEVSRILKIAADSLEGDGPGCPTELLIKLATAPDQLTEVQRYALAASVAYAVRLTNALPQDLISAALQGKLQVMEASFEPEVEGIKGKVTVH